MGFKVYYSDPAATTAAGFGKVAHLPCIFDSRPGYHRLGSRYFIERGLGIWNPETRGRAPRASVPSEQTIRNYAAWLANFLEWAEVRGVDVFTCEYAEHIQGRYQTEMMKGIWSRDASPLSPTTVNLRVQQACDFLTWSADKGYRKPFDVPQSIVRVMVGSATGSHGHRPRDVVVRQGKVRQNKRRLRMPTNGQLADWLKRVYAKFGLVRGLMCETVVLTAMRRAEVASLRVDTLADDPTQWHISNPEAPTSKQRVLVSISYGAKGPSYGNDHGDKIGPERTIAMPLALAHKLHEYQRKPRNLALRKYVKAVSGAHAQQQRTADAVHLFLDERTGERLDAKDLYNAWVGVELPYKGWSPHLGRDWWACSVLWDELQKHEHLKSLGSATAAALLESTAMSIIRLQIQPQLGHAQDSTSMVYLQWAMDMLGYAPTIQYEAEHEAAFGSAPVGGDMTQPRGPEH